MCYSIFDASLSSLRVRLYIIVAWSSHPHTGVCARVHAPTLASLRVLHITVQIEISEFSTSCHVHLSSSPLCLHVHTLAHTHSLTHSIPHSITHSITHSISRMYARLYSPHHTGQAYQGAGRRSLRRSRRKGLLPWTREVFLLRAYRRHGLGGQERHQDWYVIDRVV